jgi:hypothetical protein
MSNAFRTYLKMSENKKISCVYLDKLHAYKVVSAKTDMFCVFVKKTIFGAKIIHLSRHFLSFLHKI